MKNIAKVIYRGSNCRVRGPWSGLGLGSDYGGVGLGPDSDYGRGRTTQSGLVFANNLENIVKLTKINPKFWIRQDLKIVRFIFLANAKILAVLNFSEVYAGLFLLPVGFYRFCFWSGLFLDLIRNFYSMHKMLQKTLENCTLIYRFEIMNLKNFTLYAHCYTVLHTNKLVIIYWYIYI